MKTIFTLLLFTIFSCTAIAQNFSLPFTLISNKKASIITLEDGTKIEGIVKKVKRTKAVIVKITLITSEDQKLEIPASKIKKAKFAVHKLERFYLAKEYNNDASLNQKYDLEEDILNKEFSYFEKVELVLRGNKIAALLQPINSSFSEKIKVYNDPNAQKSPSVDIGLVRPESEFPRSYFIKKGDGPTIYLYKSNYKHHFKKIFKECPSLIKRVGKKIKWLDFEKHVVMYNECKSEKIRIK